MRPPGCEAETYFSHVAIVFEGSAVGPFGGSGNRVGSVSAAGPLREHLDDLEPHGGQEGQPLLVLWPCVHEHAVDIRPEALRKKPSPRRVVLTGRRPFPRLRPF